jgi:hypothetical protein
MLQNFQFFLPPQMGNVYGQNGKLYIATPGVQYPTQSPLRNPYGRQFDGLWRQKAGHDVKPLSYHQTI